MVGNMVAGGRLTALCLHVLMLTLFMSRSVWSRIDRQRIPEWKSDILFRLDNQEYTNASPLIGVLTQPHNPRHSKKGASQSISGPLVSWVESAGGRVVPIRYNASYKELREVFKSINGLVLPGGSGDLWYGHPFFDTAAYMWRMAMDSNGNGDVFPVFGICLGFETMHIMIANHTREELLVPSVGQESVANTIELTKDASDSLFFSYWKEMLISQVADPRLKPTFNAHEWAVPLKTYENYDALEDALTILSTSLDKDGKQYVSTVEGKHMPIFATQWHPEKPAYEFSDPTIPHTRTSVDAGYMTAQLLVEVAKLNSHKIPYDEAVSMVIQNYERVFIASDPKEVKSRDPLPDTVWMIPDDAYTKVVVF